METKYCPNCLGECSQNYWNALESEAYWCESCNISLYANSVVLDYPDLDKQREWKTRKVIETVPMSLENQERLIRLLTVK